MKRRSLSFLIATLHILIWVLFATSWPFAACKGAHEEDTGYIFHAHQVAFESKKWVERIGRMMIVHKSSEKAYYEGEMSTLIGSRPPNCDNKCGGCKPCDPIQVPATIDHFGVQFANYEPEGWKCKCGASFFNP